jgi:orotate phosphoribosyltransferase
MKSAAVRQPGAGDSSRERLRRIIKEKSLLGGSSFTLASGRQSSFFFDMKRTMFDPEGINLIGEVLYETVRDEVDVSAVGGLEVGAIPIVLAVCMTSFGQRAIDGFFVRKQAKGHGTDQRIDGQFKAGSTVVIFEDVTTTGGSSMQAVDAVRAQGGVIKKVVTIVDRLEGAREAFAAKGITLEAVYTRDDFRD